MQREHVAARHAAGGQPARHAVHRRGELAVGQRRGRSRRRSAPGASASRCGVAEDEGGEVQCRGSPALRTTWDSARATTSRPPASTNRSIRTVPTIRYASHRCQPQLRARSGLLPRARHRRRPRAVDLVRPQALRAAEHRPLLALPPHPALRRARAARRGRPARGDARGERPAAPLLRDHRRRAASCSASGSPSRSRPRWSTATSGCSSCSSPSSAAPSRCRRSRVQQAEAQRRQLAEYEAHPGALRRPAGARAPPALARARHPPGPRRRRVLGGRG